MVSLKIAETPYKLGEDVLYLFKHPTHELQHGMIPTGCCYFHDNVKRVSTYEFVANPDKRITITGDSDLVEALIEKLK